MKPYALRSNLEQSFILAYVQRFVSAVEHLSRAKYNNKQLFYAFKKEMKLILIISRKNTRVRNKSFAITEPWRQDVLTSRLCPKS